MSYLSCTRPFCHSRATHERHLRGLGRPTVYPTVSSPIIDPGPVPVVPVKRWERVTSASLVSVGERIRARRATLGQLSSVDGYAKRECYGSAMVVELGAGVTSPRISALLDAGYVVEHFTARRKLPTDAGIYRDRNDRLWTRLKDAHAADGKVWVAYDGARFIADELLVKTFGPFKAVTNTGAAK